MLRQASAKRVYQRLLVGDVTDVTLRLAGERKAGLDWSEPPVGRGEPRDAEAWEFPEDNGVPSGGTSRQPSPPATGDDRDGSPDSRRGFLEMGAWDGVHGGDGGLEGVGDGPAGGLVVSGDVNATAAAEEGPRGRRSETPVADASELHDGGGARGPGRGRRIAPPPRRSGGEGDLVISCDVFGYVGDLRPCFVAVRELIAGTEAEAAFAVSVEATVPSGAGQRPADGLPSSGDTAAGRGPGGNAGEMVGDYELQPTGRWVGPEKVVIARGSERGLWIRDASAALARRVYPRASASILDKVCPCLSLGRGLESPRARAPGACWCVEGFSRESGGAPGGGWTRGTPARVTPLIRALTPCLAHP